MVTVKARFKNGKRWEDFLREIDMLEVDTEHPVEADGSVVIEGDRAFIVSALKRAGDNVITAEGTDDVGQPLRFCAKAGCYFFTTQEGAQWTVHFFKEHGDPID